MKVLSFTCCNVFADIMMFNIKIVYRFISYFSVFYIQHLPEMKFLNRLAKLTHNFFPQDLMLLLFLLLWYSLSTTLLLWYVL